MPSEIIPYAAPVHVSKAVPEGGARRARLKFGIGLAILLLSGSIVTAVIANIDIESIIVSGPILSVAALFLMGAAMPPNLRPLIRLGVAILAMSIGCFATIYLCRWNPSDAQMPIGIAIALFAVVFQIGWMSVRSVWNQRFDSFESSAIEPSMAERRPDYQPD